MSYLCLQCSKFHNTKHLMKRCDHKKVTEIKELSLVDMFKADKNIVKGLKADDLMLLCKEFDIEYSNVPNAKTDLLGL